MNYNSPPSYSVNANEKNPLWELPEIVNLKANYVRYRQPKLRFHKARVLKIFEAVEILVKTSKELPVRALSPALFIGEKILNDYEMLDRDNYKFYVFDLKGLQNGQPIFIGWPGFPKTKIKTRFLLNLENTALT